LFGGFIYYSISRFSFTDFYKRLEIRAASIAKIKLEKNLDVGSVIDIQQDYLEKLPGQKEYIIPVKNGDLQLAGINAPLTNNQLQQMLDLKGGHFNVKNLFFSSILYKNTSGQEYLVLIGAENYFYTHHISYLRNLIISCLILSILVIVIIAIFISRTVTKPINRIIQDVKNISSENLHLRLAASEQNDMLDVLSQTFNDMLNRLETSFETQKNFISNASHELNTPLTCIIGEADLALSKERNVSEYKNALNKILEEAERLNRKTEALLFLAQTGFDGKSQKKEKVRVDELLADIKKNIKNINSEYAIKFDYSLMPENPEKLIVNANLQLLHLALTNIIINACKYSEDHTASVSLAASDKEVVLMVTDTGIGIPEQELQYIYDPYFRASNTFNHKGYGIGLPLSRNIIRMHKGTLKVSSELNKGTSVRIQIPIV